METSWKDLGWPGVPNLAGYEIDKSNLHEVLDTIKGNLDYKEFYNCYDGEKILKKYKVGYTTGVYDMFHIGHLNILKNAKEQCEYLIVGVTSDALVSYKNKKAIIPHEERMAIVESIKYVDQVVPQESMDKMAAWEEYKFDVIFVGSDWKGTDKWNEFEYQFGAVGVDIVYFPYTSGTSSTKLRDVLDKIMRD